MKPPRSHAFNCRCPRCAQFRNRKYAGDGLISFDIGCLAVILAIAGTGALIGFLSRLPGFLSRLTAGTWWTLAAGAGALAVIVFVVRIASTREVRQPEGRLHVEATPQPPAPSLPAEPAPPPACPHPGAVPVSNILTGKLEAWLCPDCGTQLDPGFRASELTPDGSWPPVRKAQ